MQAALGSRSWEGGCARRLCTHARGGVPPLRRWGALRTEPPLCMSTYAAGWVPAPQTGRLEDGAPAPHECLRRDGFRPLNDEL